MVSAGPGSGASPLPGDRSLSSQNLSSQNLSVVNNQPPLFPLQVFTNVLENFGYVNSIGEDQEVVIPTLQVTGIVLTVTVVTVTIGTVTVVTVTVLTVIVVTVVAVVTATMTVIVKVVKVTLVTVVNMNPLLCTECKPDARRRAVRVGGTQCTSAHTYCKPTVGRRALYHTRSI